jgi:hypothetical protein
MALNKYIKRKKRIKMYKNEFTKEQLLFQKQFPHLFTICDTELPNITRLDIKRVYNKATQYSTITKDEFEISIKIILFRINDIMKDFKEGSRVRHYYDLYTSLGVMFKDTEGNIKLRCC